MSLSRSSSPAPGGGWASPGLTMSASGQTSTAPSLATSKPIQWDSSARSGGSGGPTFTTKNQGFFTRHMRRISNTLPTFSVPAASHSTYAEKEKLNRGRSYLSRTFSRLPLLSRIYDAFCRLSHKTKIRFLLILIVLVSWIIFYNSRGSIPFIKSIFYFCFCSNCAFNHSDNSWHLLLAATGRRR